MKTFSLVSGIALILLILFAGCASQAPQETPKQTTTTMLETTTTSTTTTSTTTTTTTSTTTTTLPAKACWKEEYGYLAFDFKQLPKFCLCAQGTFAYKSYYRAPVYAQAYSYRDYKKSEEWSVTRSPSAYSPVLFVVCVDNNRYWTNETYYR